MIRCRPAVALLAAMSAPVALAQPPGGRAASPAARPIPETLAPQSYAAELVEAGRATFATQCGFCHGRDATGGSGGSDLTRSELVAADVRGDRIGEVVRTGRVDAGMPPFPALSGDELEGIVAYIHAQKTLAESAEGGRRAVDAADVQSGDVAAGRRYFEAECNGCHSADGDLAGIASRMQGLRLLQRMLYPGPGGFGRGGGAGPTATVTTADGETYAGTVEYQDEFTIALTDRAGRYRSFPTRAVDFEVSNPLDAHIELLGRYTDEDIHDVVTYLHTLR